MSSTAITKQHSIEISTNLGNPSPLKSFDSGASPFLNKSFLGEIFEIETRKERIKKKINGLSSLDLLEWAHFKKLKAYQCYQSNRYEACLDVLTDIFSGLDDLIEYQEEHYDQLIKEIKIPCLLKSVSCLILKGSILDADRICEYIIGLDESNQESLHKRKICAKLMKRNESKVDADPTITPINLTFLNKLRESESLSDCSSESEDPLNELDFDDMNKKSGILSYLFHPIVKIVRFAKAPFNCCDRNFESDADLDENDNIQDSESGTDEEQEDP